MVESGWQWSLTSTLKEKMVGISFGLVPARDLRADQCQPVCFARGAGADVAAMASVVCASHGTACCGHGPAWLRTVAGLAYRAIPVCEWLAYGQSAGAIGLHSAGPVSYTHL